jgi:hypothetical protein
MNREQKIWQHFLQELIIDEGVKTQIEAEEDELVEVLLGVNAYARKSPAFAGVGGGAVLDRLVQKLLGFVQKVFFFQDPGSYEESVVTALTWLIRMKEHAQRGGDEQRNEQLSAILAKYKTSQVILEIICTREHSQVVLRTLLRLLTAVLGDGQADVQNNIYAWLRSNAESEVFFARLQQIIQVELNAQQNA